MLAVRSSNALLPAVRAGCVGLLAKGMAAAATTGTPQLMKADVTGYGEGATTLISKEKYRFLVDEPPKLGGKGIGPNPLSVLLGSLVGCTQYTCSMVAREMRLPEVGAVAWAASGEYDLRGVRGSAPGVDARFRRIWVEGTFETGMSQEELDRVAEQVDRRCIVAATLKASGLELQLSMKKGEVDHDCEPACALHDLEAAAGGGGAATGQVKGQPSREADTPQFAGTGGQARAAARGYATLAARGLRTAASARGKDGEDVAREHLGAEAAPQLQKETSEQGADSTAGGAYASRDDPRSQASQPTAGKSDEQIVQEQDAGAYIHPQSAGNAEAGQPMKPGGEGAHAPSFAGDEAAEDEREEEEMGRDLENKEFDPWEQ